MLIEAGQAPAAAATLLAAETESLATLGQTLRQRPPRAMLTVARGSSDHAAHYLGYLMMARLGRLVTSLPMSVEKALATGVSSAARWSAAALAAGSFWACARSSSRESIASSPRIPSAAWPSRR